MVNELRQKKTMITWGMVTTMNNHPLLTWNRLYHKTHVILCTRYFIIWLSHLLFIESQKYASPSDLACIFSYTQIFIFPNFTNIPAKLHVHKYKQYYVLITPCNKLIKPQAMLELFFENEGWMPTCSNVTLGLVNYETVGGALTLLRLWQIVSIVFNLQQLMY